MLVQAECLIEELLRFGPVVEAGIDHARMEQDTGVGGVKPQCPCDGLFCLWEPVVFEVAPGQDIGVVDVLTGAVRFGETERIWQIPVVIGIEESHLHMIVHTIGMIGTV